MSKRKVAYFYDHDLGSHTYGLGHPMKPHRMRVTHELVTGYNMLDKMHVLRPTRATAEKMTEFHTDEYVHFLNRVTPETAEELTYHGTRFLVGEDNPAFEGVFEFCSISAGGVYRITDGAADIAINWAGGLHHAKKREASGFCYINDIVLGILELLRIYPRVLYIDIDCHHGDGVEEAFYTSDRMRGSRAYFDPVSARFWKVFRPQQWSSNAVPNSLAGDKLGCFNVSMHGHAHCTQFMRKFNIPLILLGGGGYTVKNVARAWTYETACALGIEDEIDVPENNMDDLNVKDGSLENVRINALEQLRELTPAPSVQMHDTPRESVGKHLGFGIDDGRPRDDLDERLAQHARYIYALQDSADAPSSDSEEPSDDSDESSANAWRQRTRRRMSLITNQYYDIPFHENGFCHPEPHTHHSKTTRRRFFQNGSKVEDNGVDQAMATRLNGLVRRGLLSGLMERGGSQERNGVGDLDEDWDGDVSMQ
ncbi:histone deacetylase RPD3 [Coprinopsis sp. MPI-PUGE-AT-0042]|nr:histone deacetylase RPD3 [Coprinopsis sp. MPI-PUGE-AT-0042]